MTFLLPDSPPPGGAAAAERARFAGGYDRVPFPTRATLADGALEVWRSQSESGYVAVPWPVPGVGFPVSVTATLRERAAPYRLLVELARGKLNQVRNQAADWAQLGLPPAAPVADALKASARNLSRAVQADDPTDADAAATAALAGAYQAAAALTDQFVDASLALRRRADPKLPTALGCRLSARPPADADSHIKAAFTAVTLVPNWARVETAASRYDWAPLDELVDWAAGLGLPVRLGPLIDLGGDALPPWLGEWHGEPPSLSAFFCDFVETAVHRYRNRVRDWVVCGGFNHGDHLGLADDDRLRLVVRLLDAARTADPDGRWAVGLAQPWGDYLDRDECTYSPLVFADTLLRTGLPVGGFEIELAAGDGRGASLLRDGLDTVRLLELFGVLGVPIDLLLRHPGRDPGAAVNSTLPEENRVRGGWHAADDPAAQSEWGATAAAIGLCVPHVRTITWARWADGPGGEPADGLFGPGGAKPLLARLAGLRDAYL